jgi:CrcB protein
MIKLLVIALGGAIGSLARYGVGHVALEKIPHSTEFPYGTLIVNIIGSFLIGCCINALPHNTDLRFFVVTGFLGGFTTFSAFSLDTLSLIRSGQAMYAMAYIGLSLFLSLGAIVLGAQVKFNV